MGEVGEFYGWKDEWLKLSMIAFGSAWEARLGLREIQKYSSKGCLVVTGWSVGAHGCSDVILHLQHRINVALVAMGTKIWATRTHNQKNRFLKKTQTAHTHKHGS